MFSVFRSVQFRSEAVSVIVFVFVLLAMGLETGGVRRGVDGAQVLPST